MHLKLKLLAKKRTTPGIQSYRNHSIVVIMYSLFINMLYSLWFTERSDFIVILPQVMFGNITVHKVAVENDLKAVTACAWIQTNGSAIEIKYTTKSDSCGETTALRMLLFNKSVTITVLGNDWWAFLLQLIIVNYYFFQLLYTLYEVVHRNLMCFVPFFFFRVVPSFVADEEWHYVCITWLSLGGYLKVFVDGMKRISSYEAALDGVVILGIKEN